MSTERGPAAADMSTLRTRRMRVQNSKYAGRKRERMLAVKGQGSCEGASDAGGKGARLSVVERGKIAVILARIQVGAPVVGLHKTRGHKVSNHNRSNTFLFSAQTHVV